MRPQFTKVLITVPHAECQEGNPNHTCDTSAVALANCLAADIPHSVCIVGDINRSICDLNRADKPACKTSCRAKMTAAITGGQYTVLLDAHSYPYRVSTDNSIFAEQSAAWKTNAWDHDIFFVVCDGDQASTDFFCHKVIPDMIRRLPNYSIHWYKGNDKLELIHQGYHNGLLSVLIEVSEHLSTVAKDGRISQVGELAHVFCECLAAHCKKS